MSDMIELPEPLTPADCDLRGMPYMPLDIVRLFDSDFYALSTGDEFKAGLTLWGKAFLQVPAGSLPDDDRILAHLSGAGPNWKRLREQALRGWIRCSDGRLYHRTVAEKVAEAWAARCGRKARTEAARAAKAARGEVSGSGPPPPVTETVTTSVTENVTTLPTRTVTRAVTETVTGSKGREGKGREERKKDSEADASDAVPASRVPKDARTQLFGEGLEILRWLTGVPDRPARSLLGKLLRDARDDCAAVLAILRDGADLRPADPKAWLAEAARTRGARAGTLQRIASDWNLIPIGDLDANAARLMSAEPEGSA